LGRRKGRNINGILVLDKPLHKSSNGALQEVKRLFGAAKAGHTGALDPLATGVLPLCLGEATKFSQILLDSDKRYITTAKLGVRTSTGDREGESVEEMPVPELIESEILKILEDFTGTITQIPPMYSALKHNGKPLYELARAGKTIDVKSREITILSITLLRIGEDEIDLDVLCTKGTYIRTLVEDIAKAMGTQGHVSMLRRLAAGPFTQAHQITLEELHEIAQSGGHEALDQKLLPMDLAVGDMPRLVLDESQARAILHGQRVNWTNNSPQGRVQLRYIDDTRDLFLGIGEVLVDEARLMSHRLIQVEI
jgi:tRNA pseudouridine55 synthase